MMTTASSKAMKMVAAAERAIAQARAEGDTYRAELRERDWLFWAKRAGLR